MPRNSSSSRDKLPKYLAETEVKRVLEKAAAEKRRDHLILLTLFRTGLRVSELTDLKKRDIRQKENEIVVREGKGNKDRIVPLESELGHLLGYYADDKGKHEKIFDISTRTVRNIVKRHTKDLDLSLPAEKISPHTFRHSFAVKVLKDGMDIRSLQKIMGHSNIETTMIYLDVVAEDVKQAFEVTRWD